LLRNFYKTWGFVATKKMKVLPGVPDGFDLKGFPYSPTAYSLTASFKFFLT